LKQIRRHVTYANVMSSLAVFMILGGATAFAAIQKVGANEIKANSIKTGKIVKEAVTEGKIKKNAVTESRIADGAVTANKLADNAVTTPKIANEAVTTGKLANEAVTTGKLANGAVNAAKLSGDAQPAQGFATNTTTSLEYTGTPQVVRSLSLPAGSYILTGYASANNNAATQEEASCSLTLGGTTIAATDAVNLGPNTELDRQVLPVTSGGSLGGPGVAQLVCDASTASGNWLERGLSAVKLSSFTGS